MCIVGGVDLVFRNTDGDLPWPVTRGTDIGQIIPHGPHCLKMIREFVANAPDNVVDRFHHQVHPNVIYLSSIFNLLTFLLFDVGSTACVW